MRTNVFKEITFSRLRFRFLILVCALISAVFGLLSPWFQKEFLDQLGNIATENPDHLASIVPLAYAFVCLLIAQASAQIATWVGTRESIVMQGILSQKIYDRMLELKADALQTNALGEIVAIYATDVAGATFFLEQSLPMGSTMLFPIILAPIFVSRQFGISPLLTFLVIGSVSIMSFAMAYRQSKFFYRFKQLAAERTGLVNEWIQFIRTLRILSWTEQFEKKIFRKREDETRNRVLMVTNGQIMNAFTSSMSFILNLLALFALSYGAHHALTRGEIFSLLWILGVFLVRPFRQLPWFFTFIFDSWTSMQRVQKFLNIENTKTLIHRNQSTSTTDPQSIIKVRNLNLTIHKHHILKDISLEIKKGEFVTIVGEVGSGKSTLLLSLLTDTGAKFEEYFIDQKAVQNLSPTEFRSYFSYCPQESFVMSATLQDNIYFEYDSPEAESARVLHSLKMAQFDFSKEVVSQGLKTEIGERGVNLSGGQKQRVNLARVHFQSRPIILMDDGISAVDVDTEHKLIQELFKREWRDRTRILVTHRLTVLAESDRVIFMRNGRIHDQGKYEELLSRNEDFRKFTQSINKINSAQQSGATHA